MKRLLLILCLLGSTFASAQTAQTTQTPPMAPTADRRIGSLLGGNDWFALNREMQRLSPEEVNPLLWQMAEVMLAHNFNRPEKACESIRVLLEKHQGKLGPENTVNMSVLWSLNLARMNRYDEAAKLLGSLLSQLSAQGAAEESLAPLCGLQKMYALFHGEGNICRPLHPEGTYRLPFMSDSPISASNGRKHRAIMLDGRINGSESPLLFDTGAGMNVISPDKAREYGLRFTDVSLGAEGVGQQNCTIAIADTLRIGDMLWQNVPFGVLDIRTGRAEADEQLRDLSPVVGLPIMMTMREIRFDFLKSELEIPARPTSNPLPSSNLILDNSALRLESFIGGYGPVCLHFDTGATFSALFQLWFDLHRSDVERLGQPDSLRVAGVGGTSCQQTYRMPRLRFSLGSGEASIDSMQVCTGIDLHTGNPLEHKFAESEGIDGIAGLDFLEHFSRVILNLEQMYIEGIGSRP